MFYQDKYMLPVAVVCYLQNFIQSSNLFSGDYLYVIAGCLFFGEDL